MFDSAKPVRCRSLRGAGGLSGDLSGLKKPYHLKVVMQKWNKSYFDLFMICLEMIVTGEL